jgi:hypothetical protein
MEWSSLPASYPIPMNRPGQGKQDRLPKRAAKPADARVGPASPRPSAVLLRNSTDVRRAELPGVRAKTSKTTPCKVAGGCRNLRAGGLDASGKSAAQLHHPEFAGRRRAQRQVARMSVCDMRELLESRMSLRSSGLQVFEYYFALCASAAWMLRPVRSMCSRKMRVASRVRRSIIAWASAVCSAGTLRSGAFFLRKIRR